MTAKNKKVATWTIGIIIGLAIIGSLTPEETATSSTEPKKETKDVLLTNRSWDGSVYFVKEYLKANLNDWDSYESIEWSTAVKNDDGTYMVRNKFRAANALGAQVIQNWIFYYNDQGQILNIIGDE